MSKCIVCGREGAKKMSIMDGYMDKDVFDVCANGTCHRRIVSGGVAVWRNKLALIKGENI